MEYDEFCISLGSAVRFLGVMGKLNNTLFTLTVYTAFTVGLSFCCFVKVHASMLFTRWQHVVAIMIVANNQRK